MTLTRYLGIICRRFLNNVKPSALVQSSRGLHTTNQGKSISCDELFTYTNGHFHVNEVDACNQRYVRFDIDQLCAVAATAGGSHSPIRVIDKMESGFSRALLMQKEDGSEVIAKIPFPVAGPPKYTTASEVAVLKFSKTTALDQQFVRIKANHVHQR